jgi:hypothetical protein
MAPRIVSPLTFYQEQKMNTFKSKALFAATLATLAVSASAFASDYSDAMSSARSTYRDDMSKCKSMSGADRGSCMHDAKATRHTAMVSARGMRHPHEADKHSEGDEKIKN